MFEGMSDDEDDFQSVSHSARYSTSDIMYRTTDDARVYFCVSKCVSKQGSPAGPSHRAGGSAGIRPVSLSHSGATGPRPITQSELATALALASTPDSSAVTPTTSSQVRFLHLEKDRHV